MRLDHIWVIDPAILRRPGRYLYQCGLATLALLLMLLLQGVVLKAAIVVAVASTACIVFIVPDSVAANPRKVVGGHLVGVIVGTFFSGLLVIPSVGTAIESFRIVLDVVAELSVGVSMIATNTEHPPAAGTALGLVVHGWSISAVVFIISGAIVLSIARVILRPRLVNLL